MTKITKIIPTIFLSAIMLTSVFAFTNIPQASAQTTTINFNGLITSTGFPPTPIIISYTESGMTVTSLQTHLHGLGGLFNHRFAGSTPYVFDCGGNPFTVVSFDLRNRFANFNTNTFTSSSSGFLQVFGPATGITPPAGFVGITSFKWDTNGFVIMNNLVIEGCTTIPVDIDIKPGSFPSSVDCTEKQPVPVAIFSSPTFDATTIDIEIVSMSLVGLDPIQVTEVHNKIHIEDKNKDEIPDAVLHLDRSQVCDATSDAPLKDTVVVILTGFTTDGIPFEGKGDIRITGR